VLHSDLKDDIGRASNLLILINVTSTLLCFLARKFEGGASIMFAFEHRRQFTARWAWMVLSDIVDLMLGTIIIFDLPGTSEWTMGLLIAGLT
jgi:uncharacterized membrane protein HdeD (DUF308 family)